LTNLVDSNDEGKQLAFKETKSIISGSDERLYKWLHSYAGLHLTSTSQTSQLEKIQFASAVS